MVAIPALTSWSCGCSSRLTRQRRAGSPTTSLRVGELVLALARTRRGHIVASSGILSGLISGPTRTWRGGEIDQFIRPDLNMYPGFPGVRW